MQTKHQTVGGKAPDLPVLALPTNAQVLFASDMHLGNHDPATADWFCSALNEQLKVTPATHLILLGDLFEAWVGDDQTDRFAQQLVTLIGRLVPSTPVFVMRGNRDFLLDRPFGEQASFSQQTGATMLADPCLVTMAGSRWVLTHGDFLCTDDKAYQDFRATSRTTQWQHTFLSQPLEQRMALATQMRAQSEKEKANKSAHLTDVSQSAVQACLDAHDAPGMIHGHTHRPNKHLWSVDGVEFVRHVLPDWDFSAGTGGFGWLNDEGFQVLRPSPQP